MFAGRAISGSQDRDAGSMPIAILLALVGMTLSASLTTMVVGQLKDSRWSADRTAAVAASQAGLDAGLASIRATGGDYTRLPCTTAAGSLTVLAGTSTAAAPTYSVSFGYFTVDPSGMVGDLAPIGDLTNMSSSTSGAVTCVGGKLPKMPGYALLRSVGRVGGSTRTLYATYPFRTSGIVSPGGHVVIVGGGGKYCLGGSNVPPVEGDPVVAVLCTGSGLQNIINYQSNNSLVLTLSLNTTAYPNGLCITVARQANNVAATFQQCATSSPTQQWSYDVTTQTLYAGTFSSGLCLNADTTGQELSPIVLRNGTDCGTPGVSGKAMVPESGVGAGGIAKIGQFSNYGAVGRCLDFGASASPSSTLLLLGCQANIGVGSSQYWIGPTILSGTYKATAPIYVPPPPGTTKPYCLKSPGSGGGAAKLAPCNSNDNSLNWTVYDAAPRSIEAYRIMDLSGNCLKAAPAAGNTNPDPATWTQVVTGACDGSAVQKWNVPVGGSSIGPFRSIQEK